MTSWRKRGRARAVMLAALAALPALIAGCASGGDGQSAPAGSGEGEYERVIRHVLPSVVEIQAGNLTGSGVVFNSRDDIVTNAHVLGDSTNIHVILSAAAKPLRARLVGLFTPDDIAVIQVARGSELRPVRWADSARAQVGQIVLAMGSPYGLVDSVTQGIISATGRTVTGPPIAGQPPTVLTNALQTSAAINPGNSGGALVALSGAVLGIPTLAARDPELGGAASGIGFAIPSNTVRHIADQLINTGHVTRSDRASLQFKGNTAETSGLAAGVAVTTTAPDGAAELAGIRPGDVIVAVDGYKTTTLSQLENLLIGYRPGQVVQVQVRLPDGKQRQVRVKLGSLGNGQR